MAVSVMVQLPELQKSFDRRITKTVIARIQNQSRPQALVDAVMIANGNWAVKPKNGASSLSQLNNQQSIRKVKTLWPGEEGNVTYQLNSALLGGSSYPILTTALGIAAGFSSAGAGLLFTIGTTGLSLTQTSQRVLARTGDEIWHVEEIGKVKNGGTYEAVYVTSFFLVDPFRRQAPTKGWLIHEERKNLILS